MIVPFVWQLHGLGVVEGVPGVSADVVCGGGGVDVGCKGVVYVDWDE